MTHTDKCQIIRTLYVQFCLIIMAFFNYNTNRISLNKCASTYLQFWGKASTLI